MWAHAFFLFIQWKLIHIFSLQHPGGMPGLTSLVEYPPGDDAATGGWGLEQQGRAACESACQAVCLLACLSGLLCLPVCLSDSVSACLSTYLPVCLSAPCVWLRVRLKVFACPSTYLSIFICLFVYNHLYV